MKYDPKSKRLERDLESKERHRNVREHLSFIRPPTIEQVQSAVDTLVQDGLLPSVPAGREVATLAETLREERKRQGLTLAEVATKSGLEVAAISGLESGQPANPSLETLILWARALGKRLTLSDAMPK